MAQGLLHFTSQLFSVISAWSLDSPFILMLQFNWQAFLEGGIYPIVFAFHPSQSLSSPLHRMLRYLLWRAFSSRVLPPAGIPITLDPSPSPVFGFSLDLFFIATAKYLRKQMEAFLIFIYFFHTLCFHHVLTSSNSSEILPTFSRNTKQNTTEQQQQKAQSKIILQNIQTK